MAFYDQVEQKLLPASFKGIPFLVSESRITGGRKKVKHEYPNTKRRYVEDLGGCLKNIELTILIHGVNYLQERDRFVAILEEDQDPGVLVHPWLGTLQVVADKYTMTETHNSLGVATITIPFYEVDGDSPSLRQNVTSQRNVQALAQTLSINNGTNFINTVRPSTNNRFIYDNLTGTIQNAYTLFNTIFAALPRSAGQTSALLQFEDRQETNASNPEQLVADTEDVFDEFMTNESVSYEDKFKTLQEISEGYNPEIIEIPVTHIEQENRNNNLAISRLIKIDCLAAMAEAAANINFRTTSQLTEYRNIYQSLMECFSDYETDVTISRELDSVKSDLFIYFDSLEVNLDKIADINHNEVNLKSLLYSMYGDLSNYSTIFNLNELDSSFFIPSPIKVLTR